MQIQLTADQVRVALGSGGLALGLRRYWAIQSCFAAGGSVRGDEGFRRLFNGFYRVRRDVVWQDAFYGLMDRARVTPMGFGGVLRRLHELTGQCEASFASKLVATVDPEWPVIDAFVLKHVGARLPYCYARDRLARVETIHADLRACFDAYLASEDGRFVVREFKAAFPDCAITPTKMLDLVLWQSR